MSLPPGVLVVGVGGQGFRSREWFKSSKDGACTYSHFLHFVLVFCILVDRSSSLGLCLNF